MRGDHTRTLAPARARARAAGPLNLERTLSDLVNQAYALTPAEIALMRQTAAMGIAVLADGCYHQGVKTLTMKVPDELLGWLENEARQARQPKSALVREILQQHRQRRHESALDLAADLCGCVRSGMHDLSRNKKHLKGFGR